MSKTLLIAGIDFAVGADYLQKALLSDRKVCIAKYPDSTDAANTENTVVWNRLSPISARSIIVQTEARYADIHEALIIFDAAEWNRSFKNLETDIIAEASETMIQSYLYLVTELLADFAKKGSGRLIFLQKYLPSAADIIKSNSAKTQSETEKAGILTAVAQQSFTALAELVAAQQSAASNPSVLLLRAECGSRHTDIAEWLFPFLDAIPESDSSARKKASSQIKWTAYGTKSLKQGLFSH